MKNSAIWVDRPILADKFSDSTENLINALGFVAGASVEEIMPQPMVLCVVIQGRVTGARIEDPQEGVYSHSKCRVSRSGEKCLTPVLWRSYSGFSVIAWHGKITVPQGCR